MFGADPTHHPKPQLRRFTHFCTATHWLQWGAPHSPLKLPPPVDRSQNPTTCLIPGPIRPTIPNRIHIRTAVFPQCIRQTDACTVTHTHTHRNRMADGWREYSMSIGRFAVLLYKRATTWSNSKLSILLTSTSKSQQTYSQMSRQNFFWVCQEHPVYVWKETLFSHAVRYIYTSWQPQKYITAFKGIFDYTNLDLDSVNVLGMHACTRVHDISYHVYKITR